jgi:NADH dehydrogenase
MKKHIVIVGAGFAGLTTALKLSKNWMLERKGYDIILVDRHHHHLYTPGLYEIAAVPKDYASDHRLIGSALIAVNEIMRGRRIRFICDEFINLDTTRRRIVLAERGILSYEYLVLALGAENNYFNIPGLKEYAIPLKTGDDATLLRNAVEAAVQKKSSLKIVIGGAGSAGVELAAELVNFISTLKAGPALQKNRDVQILVVESGPEILSGFTRWAVRLARARLSSLGVAVKTENTIIAASPKDITMRSGERLPYDILVWTGGVRGPQTLSGLGLPLSPKGTLIVNSAMRVEGAGGRVFAVGDNAWFIRPGTKKPLAWNVPVAEAEARHAAREIVRAVGGKPPNPFRPMRRYPFVIAVGKKYALADLTLIRFSGPLGWCVKQFVELNYLLFLLPWPRAFALWWKNIRLYSSND